MQNFINKLVDVVILSQQSCTTPIDCHLAYATAENFLGRIVAGYHPEVTKIAYMTPSSAEALCKVQNELNKMQLGLFVFDSFRPLRATEDFKHWMQQPPHNEYELERKIIHYPYLPKNQLAKLGYLAEGISNHCYGDTVDLGLIDLKTQQLLDMGACFDYFDEISHTTASAEQIGINAFQNRILLSDAMQNAGFIPYEKEFWHFTYHIRELNEPMDFEIK